MSVVRSGALAAWTCAWLAGRISLDEVVDATTGADAPHVVNGLSGFEHDVALREVLVAWRRRGAQPRLVLPVPGDVRGLPGPAGLRVAALEAGEAVVADGLGVAPRVTKYAPSSAPPDVVWVAFAADAVPVDPLTVREAQYDLTTAIRESASALAGAGSGAGFDLGVGVGVADVGRGAGGFGYAGRGPGVEVPAVLSRARGAGEFVNLPPGHPAPAVGLLAQAERLQAVLDLAFTDPLGGTLDQQHGAARTDALRALATAVRRARLAAVNAGASATPL